VHVRRGQYEFIDNIEKCLHCQLKYMEYSSFSFKRRGYNIVHIMLPRVTDDYHIHGRSITVPTSHCAYNM